MARSLSRINPRLTHGSTPLLPTSTCNRSALPPSALPCRRVHALAPALGPMKTVPPIDAWHSGSSTASCVHCLCNEARGTFASRLSIGVAPCSQQRRSLRSLQDQGRPLVNSGEKGWLACATWVEAGQASFGLRRHELWGFGAFLNHF